MWILLGILSGLLFTAQGLLTRSYLKKNDDSWAYSLIFSLIGSAVTFPLALLDWRVEADAQTWLILIGTTLIIVAYNWLYFTAAKNLEASLSGIINKTRLIWAFLLGFLLLDQTADIGTFTAIILSFAATLVVSHTFRKPEKLQAIYKMLLAGFLGALLLIGLKGTLDDFSPLTFIFVASFAMPAVANLVLMPRPLQRSKKLLENDPKLVIQACIIGALANIILIFALDLAANTSALLVIMESTLVLTLVGEHLFLKETDHLKQKTIAVLLAILSAILLV